MYEYRKWGTGSSCYEVSLKTNYDRITKRYSYKYIGMVVKEGNKWVVVGKDHITGKTRKEVADILAKLAE